MNLQTQENTTWVDRFGLPKPLAWTDPGILIFMSLYSITIAISSWFYAHPVAD